MSSEQLGGLAKHWMLIKSSILTSGPLHSMKYSPATLFCEWQKERVVCVKNWYKVPL